MNTDRAAVITYKHIARVRELLGSFAIEMIKRGDRHGLTPAVKQTLGEI